MRPCPRRDRAARRGPRIKRVRYARRAVPDSVMLRHPKHPRNPGRHTLVKLACFAPAWTSNHASGPADHVVLQGCPICVLSDQGTRMKNQNLLKVIAVEGPCRAAWDEMSGGDSARFCAHCNRTVHNLSAMQSSEAEQLLCESAGKLCVRFERGPDGVVRTLDYQPVFKNHRRRRLWTFVAACLAAMAGTAYALHLLRKPPPVQVYLGSSMFIVPPE